MLAETAINPRLFVTRSTKISTCNQDFREI